MLGVQMSRKRLDNVLVEQGLAPTRDRARALIMSGAVRVADRRMVKAGVLVETSAPIHISEAPPYVSRGGQKLAHALATFPVDPSGLVALDIGASTGGFTDCLLQHGAQRVYAVDVGYGQLDYGLRQDPRVVVMERVNARHSIALPELCALATMDVSFISVTKVIPAVVTALEPGSHLIVLVKPQFEAGRGQVGKGGVVKDPRVHAAVLSSVIRWAVDNRLRIQGLTPSPLLGDAGNREFLLLLKTPS